MVDIGACCAAAFEGLDEDALDYISSCCGEDGEVTIEEDDLRELVVPMLLDADFVQEEPVANQLVVDLWARLHGACGGCDGGAQQAMAAREERRKALEPKLLGKKIDLRKEAQEYDRAAAKAAVTADKTLVNQEIDTTAVDDADGEGGDPKAAANAAARCARLTAAVLQENAALEAEIAAAQETAALSRTQGADNHAIGVIETGEFSLPNPGGGPDLLESAAAVLVPGHRYGLIGRNGKGKSTLLKYLSARRVGGLSANVSLHYVSQTVADMGNLETATPMEIVLQADVERSMLVKQIEQLEGVESPTIAQINQLQIAHGRMQEIGGDGAEGRVAKLLQNLGFSDELAARSVKDLSGGWRVRVALAAALFAAPDVLLLDEPTNHLSIEAVLWLSKELSTSAVWSKRIIVCVSHDRAFLDDVTTDQLHISGVARRLTQERGNYSMWAKRRDAKKKAWLEKSKKRQMQMDHLKEFIDRGGTYANVSVQRKMKEEQLAKLQEQEAEEAEELAVLVEDEELPLTLLAGGSLDRPPIQVSEVSFSYPGMSQSLFDGAELCVDGKMRLVLLGENGRGKTTLVKLMLGELEPTTGVVHRNSGARIALVNQHHADQINLDQTPLDYLRAQFKGDGSRDHEGRLRAHLSSCGISSDLQLVPGRGLSGGQRSRLAMAAVSMGKPHVLILDEPTNNLDLEAVEALAKAVQQFEGSVVIVSHDQYFVSQVATDVLVIQDRKVTKVDSFDAYIAAAHSRADSQ